MISVALMVAPQDALVPGGDSLLMTGSGLVPVEGNKRHDLTMSGLNVATSVKALGHEL